MKLLLFFLFSSQVFAVVDPGTGTYLLQHTDFLTSQAITPFKISRTYNHKNNTSGYFGKKWCSNLDETIVQKGNIVVLQNCGKDTDAVFTKNKKVYQNKESSEYILKKKKDNGFLLVTRSELVSYNSEGRLISRRLKSSPKKPYIQIMYNQQQEIAQIVHVNKWNYTFVYNNSNHIIQIRGPEKKLASYTYDINGHLNQVTDVWNNNVNYTSDSNGRITEFKNGSDVEHIEYFAQNNMVKQAKDSRGCIYNLNYNLDTISAKLKTTVNNSCDKKQKIIAINSSPVFFKNKNKEINQSRMPSSEEKPLLSDKITSKPAWQSFKTSTSLWQFVMNENGNIVMVKEKNIKSTVESLLVVKYEDQKLIEMLLNKKGLVRLSYNNHKLSQISSLSKNLEAQKTFHFFTRFIKAKAEAYL